MVGDLSRTRLYGIKYLFLLGVNDGNIPMTGDGGGILSDAEREFLAGESYALAPTAREKIYTEQFYLYLCLTKPSQRLYLTYSATANDGCLERIVSTVSFAGAGVSMCPKRRTEENAESSW